MTAKKSDIELKSDVLKMRISEDKKLAFKKSVKIVYGKDCTASEAMMKFIDTVIQGANKKRRIVL